MMPSLCISTFCVASTTGVLLHVFLARRLLRHGRQEGATRWGRCCQGGAKASDGWSDTHKASMKPWGLGGDPWVSVT